MKSLLRVFVPTLMIVAAAGLTGCATKGYVNTRLDELATNHSQRLDALTRDQATLQNSTTEALTRAETASKDAAEAREIALGKVGLEEIGTSTVYFGFNKDELSSESASALDQVTQQIIQNPYCIVDVYGFADPKGSDRYNLDLGQRRANEVVRYLVDKSSSNLSRFAAVSYGERPMSRRAPQSLENSHQRRVVVSLLKRVPAPPATGETKPQAPVAQLP